MNIGVINGLHPAKEDHMFDRVAALGLTTCQVNIWNSKPLQRRCLTKARRQA